MIVTKRSFFWCFILVVLALSAAIVAQDRPAAEVRNAKESDLIAVLKSDVPKADKAIPCKQLAIYGTEKAIPALAPLLADEELASWARIAIEAIPGPAAEKALRDAMDEVEGRLLVGIINSIAVRRDQRAVEALIEKLDDSQGAVASAAAVALGHIGGEKAAEALTKSLSHAGAEVRSSVAMGCILSAEWFLDHGKTADAVKLYDTIRKADVSGQRHLEAIRGAILARGSAGVPLLVEQLESQDKERLGIGLRAARELPGRDVTRTLADELDRLSPDRRPLLLLAIADRNDASVLPTVKNAAKKGRKDLRITAMRILIDLGDVSCVPLLLDAATGDDAEIKATATETLIRLPGENVDAAYVAHLPKAQGKLRRVLIEVVGQRQIHEAIPAVVTSLDNNNADIRGEAVRTIGIIGDDKQADDLVELLQETDDPKQQAEIEKALLSISGRSGDKCLPHLRPLTRSNDNQLNIIGLHAMAVIGGSEALQTVESAIENAEPPVQDEAVRILSTWPNNWPEDDDAGEALLALAGSAEKLSHQILALRGYLQYVRGNKKLSNEQKAAKVKDLQFHIKRPEEKRLAIAALADAPSAEGLDMLRDLAKEEAVAEEAYSGIAKIAGRHIQGVSKEDRREALQMVIENSKNGRTKQTAQKALGAMK